MTSFSAREITLQHWYRRTAISALLVPLAALFALIVAIRRRCYRTGLLRTLRLPVPVLVVGNLTVGGTGKTPLVLWIAKTLQRAGRSPGIVLRGYAPGAGNAGMSARRVDPFSDPRISGDEAVLLAERSACPVWVGGDRVAAALALLAAHPGCDVIICDDGLQHYRLGRDFEIAVEDERGHGNGRLLPAGPLREPADRRVDVTLVNAADSLPLPRRNGPVLRMKAHVGDWRRVEATGVESVSVGIDELIGKRLHAVAGIGNPARFFATLKGLGLDAITHPLPDHHGFTEADLDFADCDAVLMTEKDAVKCRALAGGRLKGRLIALRIDADPDPALAEMILTAMSAAPGAHPHGAPVPGSRT
ncbi:MAG: tetraacyldisaccharide 4'-kinase [Betaproteobacteria bacterium]|nr:tetraacyldisaccharide 4'-kinase [Betaproteobacteria bacterium]